MEIYKASLDNTSKAITAFVFVIAFIGIAMCFLAESGWYFGLMLSFIPIVLIIITYAFMVQAYQITDKELIIKRPIAGLNKKILLTDIESIQLLNKEDIKGTIRTAGDGGLFGYYGYFFNKKLRNFTMYSTNSKNMILLTVGEFKTEVVISPDDITMAGALQERIKMPIERL